MNDIIDGIAIFIVLLGIFSPISIICLIHYFKKRLEHKEIMAAIEKGMPLSELRPVKKVGPTWIRNLTGGISLLIIAAAIVLARLVYIKHSGDADFNQTLIYFFIAAVFFALGISRLIRGILQRKAEQQNILNGNNGVVDKSDTASQMPPSSQNNLQ